MRSVRSLAVLSLFALVLHAVIARATEPGAVATPSAPFEDDAILRRPAYFRLESVTTRVTAFDQRGTGYQSQAGPLLGAGSERTFIYEPIVEAVVAQGDRLKHRLTIPIDVVTAASPDATDRRRNPKVDVISGASRKNLSATFDWTATYALDADSDVSFRSGFHIEEPFRSWHGGLSSTHVLRDGTLTVSAGVLEVLDWFDDFDSLGYRSGRTPRISTTGNLGATQILTPSTSVTLNYGLTVQKGELSNTWNSVPTLAKNGRTEEALPRTRVRHALVGRLSQFLPWNGALHVYYRLYDDDWGIVAHSAQAELMQRLTPWLYVSGLYRFHHQTGADFFTTLATPDVTLRTADSDLAPLDAQTVGGKIVIDAPMSGALRLLHLDIGYEHYFRSNDLRMDVVTCGSGYRF
jgi:hypothetical protein